MISWDKFWVNPKAFLSIGSWDFSLAFNNNAHSSIFKNQCGSWNFSLVASVSIEKLVTCISLLSFKFLNACLYYPLTSKNIKVLPVALLFSNL